MNEIGLLLRTTRENSGVTIKEASDDLNINTLVLENIEDGNIGCFKDIFELKNYIKDYAKYLGIDSDSVIDEFNEYMFDYTSKIPIKNIQKKVRKKEKEIRTEEKQKEIVSPYTKVPKAKDKTYLIYVGFILSFLIVVTAIFFIIKYCFFS